MFPPFTKYRYDFILWSRRSGTSKTQIQMKKMSDAIKVLSSHNGNGEKAQKHKHTQICRQESGIIGTLAGTILHRLLASDLAMSQLRGLMHDRCVGWRLCWFLAQVSRCSHRHSAPTPNTSIRQTKDRTWQLWRYLLLSSTPSFCMQQQSNMLARQEKNSTFSAFALHNAA